jgi:hypothetical protein
VKFSNVIVRVVAVFIAVSVLQLVAGAVAALIIPVKTPLPPNLMRHFLQWMFLTNAVTILALSPLAVRSEWRGWKLGAAVAAIPAVIAILNGIEGSIFLKNAHIEWPRILLTTIIAAVLSVPMWMLLFGRRADQPHEHFHPIASKSRVERAWKFALSDFSYLFLYYTAGMIIFPFVKAFYATQQLPSPGTIIALQLLLRGPVFVLLCIGLTRMLGLPRVSGALAVGLLFTLLSGVAPLLMPNPYFPDSVRWTHFCEVTSSNFVFGAIVAWLWGQRKPVASQVLAQAA